MIGLRGFYDDLFMAVVYRAYHNSFKVSFADVFYNDFIDYIVGAYGFEEEGFLAVSTRGVNASIYVREEEKVPQMPQEAS